MGAVCTVHASGKPNPEDSLSNGDNPEFEEACANARLIAAAPDLLGALESCVAQMEAQMTAPFLGRAKEAIAKARGAK